MIPTRHKGIPTIPKIGSKIEAAAVGKGARVPPTGVSRDALIPDTLRHVQVFVSVFVTLENHLTNRTCQISNGFKHS